MRASDKPLPPLEERPEADILKAILDLFSLCRLMHFQARGETYFVCDRGGMTKKGAVPIYVERELPLREAGELVAELLRGFSVGDEWRWRLVLCPAQERTRAGIHLLLADPPRRGRPWTEPTWMRASTADERRKRSPARPRPRTVAHDGPTARATMGAGVPA